MKAFTVGILVTAFATTAAHAQDKCQAYIGQTISPKTFDAVAANFGKLTPKGEYETSAQYDARKSAIVGNAALPTIIAKEPEDRATNFAYDADTQRLRIKTYAFHNLNWDSTNALIEAGLNEKLHPASENIEVVISKVDRPKGIYLATNSFGAKTKVVKVESTIKDIFDRGTDYFHAYLFPAAAKAPYVVGELALTAQEAQALKPKLKLALVITPKEPFLVRGSHQFGEPTIQSPLDITENYSVLVADINCGLLTDGTNKVLGAYPTQAMP